MKSPRKLIFAGQCFPSKFRSLFVCLAFLAGIITGPNSVAAQSLRQAPGLPESGIVLQDSPQPLKFFDVTGPESAVFGRQDGQFEAWIYPIKLLHNFRLEF